MKIWIWIGVVAGWGIPTWGQEKFQFMRTPNLSPDGSKVAFSYQGDIWVVSTQGGRALRLTVHPGHEWNPKFSPDGNYIAFNSDRYGRADIFVMNSGGSRPRRLTHYSGGSYLCGWDRKGEHLIFASRRKLFFKSTTLYQVSRKGGTPKSYLPVMSFRASLSRRGDKVAFVKGLTPWWRKKYRGSGNREIFIRHLKTGKTDRFTNFDGRDDFPCWSALDKGLYYTSNRSGVANLYYRNMGSRRPRQLTFFREDGARFLTMSQDGSTLAMAVGLDIWIYTPAQQRLKKLEITGPMDSRRSQEEWKTYTSKARRWALSPNGRFIAFVVKGEVFVMDAVRGGKARQITQSASREREVNWAPDSKTLLYTSNRMGNYDIFSCEPLAITGQKKVDFLTALKFQQRQLTTSDRHERHPQYSPDGKKIAFVQGRGDLAVMSKNGGSVQILHQSWNRGSFAWSPDSRWLAFSAQDDEFNSEVYVIRATGGKPLNISQHPDQDDDPEWSPNGRFIAFSSRRNNDDRDIWVAYLKREDYETSGEEWNRILSDKKKKLTAGKNLKVSIDEKGVHMRIKQLTSFSGDEESPVFSADGKYLVFSGDHRKKEDLYSVRLDGKKVVPLTSGNYKPDGAQPEPRGSHIYFKTSSGTFARVAVAGKKVTKLPFKARMKIDMTKRRQAVFTEAWSLLEENFYDPNFHKVNWKEMKKKYYGWIAHAQTDRDFYDVVKIMLGELNASHLGIRGPRPSHVTTGMLGVVIEPLRVGVKVKRVIPQSPAHRVKSRLLPGDVIRQINQKTIYARINYYELLADTVGEKVVLEILRNGRSKEIVIRPISTTGLRKLVYLEWVKENRSWVEKNSGQRVGYVHIQGMNWSSFERFERQLYSAGLGKKALVIDVRYNGGGWTTDYLLAILMVKRHAYTIPRGGGRGYPQGRLPLYAWTKPIVVLCNEASFSNAEIFSHAVKTLKRGKVIGQPTFGGVISTYGTRLLDDSYFRLPFRGWYVKGRGVNMENNGAVPDIVVENPPGEMLAGKDRQLERALAVLKDENDLGKVAPKKTPDESQWIVALGSKHRDLKHWSLGFTRFDMDVRRGVLVAENNSTRHQMRAFGEPHWKNYIIEYKFKVTRGDCTLITRYRQRRKGRYMRYAYTIFRHSQLWGFPFQGWVHIQWKIHDDSYQYRIRENGTWGKWRKASALQDNSQSGGVGFMISPRSKFYIKEMKVRLLSDQGEF